ncbi:aspartate/glutamate racemase family protein [Polaromonas sp. YR568]|uniref:aspartate/glutamate racemase family protein n=1 Tax=Polaromonas sp. YR568 TaxID=1855301 RepID=UPI00398BC114
MARIALIHALVHSMAPVNEAFQRLWPEARLVNLLDDSLSRDLAEGRAGLDETMHQRFETLARYAVEGGAQAILFTCSAFGPCIERVARQHPGIPVLKPNEAMIEEAAGQAGQTGPLGLIATFAPTLQSMPAEFPPGTELRTALAVGAMEALNDGDAEVHDTIIAIHARRLTWEGCTRVALAQFSMARARAACETSTGLPVFTTVDSAVRKMRALLPGA